MLEDGYERMVGLGLLGVITFLAWPIWLMIAAAEHHFTREVALSALLPLSMTLFWLAVALRVPARISRHWHHGTHALGDQLHGGSHRHA